MTDPNAPDPGPQPEEDNGLTNDQIIAKYYHVHAFGEGDPTDNELREQILQELVFARKLSIAVNRKDRLYREANEAWLSAYIRRYGTDEG